jgi:sialate O-acetylesterase
VRAGDERIGLHDVLVGDVWVASGQSNMEFRLSEGMNAAREIANARDSLIREFKVPNSWSADPEDDLAGGAWAPADPQHAGSFSAVAYFFARDLRKSEHVPIGIVNSTWGGSNIETWISRAAQHITDAEWAAMRRAEDAYLLAVRDTLQTRIGGLPSMDSGLVSGRAVWADPTLDDSRWGELRVPAYWEAQGYPAMDGVAWYRVTVDLDSTQVAHDATLIMQAIDDDDISWMNGVEIGRTNGYNIERTYRVPASAMRAGRNLLAVRVADGGGGGGINGPVALAFADGTTRSLAGRWKFKVGVVSFQPDGQRINKIPSVLYNKMLHPLLPLPITGVIWYQGESNANNDEQAAAYREQFATLIQSWRRTWAGGREAFPFLWVQLPNFGAPDTVPPLHAAWALQRESMDAALALPNTGRAVTIDVGEADNIHPRNKQDVGARMALVARKVAYGETVLASGPTYRSHVVLGDTVIVRFANAGGGLATRSGDERVHGFELAGADRKFVWADARIEGGRVAVWSGRVPHPVAVRYAWANNPDRADLYNRERLPAAPFRTDRW